MPGGGGGQMNQMMKQVQKMQADMAAAQEALAQATVEGSAGGGMVKVVVTGAGEVQSVQISPEVVDPDDVEMLEDLVLAAVGDGLRRAQEMQSREPGRRHRRPRPRRSRRLSAELARLTREQPVRRAGPGAHRRARSPARRRPEVGAADRVLPAEGRARRRQPPRPRDHRGEGARHLVPAVLQHLRGRALRLLPRRPPRRHHALRGRGAPRHRRGRAHPRVRRSLPRAPGRDLADRGHRARAAPGQGAAGRGSTPRASPR